MELPDSCLFRDFATGSESIEYQNSQIVPSCSYTVKPETRGSFSISEGLNSSRQRQNFKQSLTRHVFKHPPHQSVKRAEVDQGDDDVDKVPAPNCLVRVPTNSKAAQLSVQHALMLGAHMHEFSLFRCGARGAEMLERCAKVYTHIQVSKAAKHAVLFVVLRNMQRRRLNLTQLDKLRDDQLPQTTKVLNTRVISVTRHIKVQKESEL